MPRQRMDHSITYELDWKKIFGINIKIKIIQRKVCQTKVYYSETKLKENDGFIIRNSIIFFDRIISMIIM